MEAATLSFDNTSTYTYQFLNTYNSVPNVVATANDSNGDINVYIQSISMEQVVIAVSRDYTGDVDIQVMWIDGC